MFVVYKSRHLSIAGAVNEDKNPTSRTHDSTAPYRFPAYVEWFRVVQRSTERTSGKRPWLRLVFQLSMGF